MYFSPDGYIIALTPEIFDYNGWNFLFASHATIRMEVGKGHLQENQYYSSVVSEYLLGVTYLDNNLYGGRDRIFDITKEGKSLLLYPGSPNYLILEPGVATPGSCIHKQLQWLNWF